MSIVKLANYRCVWNYIHLHGTVTIPQISQATGLSLPTVTRAVDFGVSDGLICACGIVGGERGRKAQTYSVNSDFMHFLFISLHCHRLYFQVQDFLRNIVKSGDFQTDDSSVLSDIKKVIEKYTHDYPLVNTVGISFSGTINDGTVYESYDYPSLNGFDLKGCLEREYGKSVFVENNLYAAVYASLRYLPDAENKVIVSYLFGDDGYGSGILINGKLLRGSAGSAGKITNIVVTQADRRSNAFYGEVLRSLSAIINPDKVILYPHGKANSKKVQSLAFSQFSAQKPPECIADRSFSDDVFLGLRQMCNNILLEAGKENPKLNFKLK
ncbi:MAG: ROK family protein [Acutalibacteraceae bacterium]